MEAVMSDTTDDAKDKAQGLFEKAKDKVGDAKDKVAERVDEYNAKEDADLR
jgi:hypothetical protein